MSPKLTWSHYSKLIKIDNKNKRRYIKYHWYNSSNNICKSIETNLKEKIERFK